MNISKSLAVLTSVFALSSCGGSSDSTSGSNGSNGPNTPALSGTPLTAQQFAAAIQDGVYRIEFDANISGNLTIGSFNVTTNGGFEGSNLASLIANNGTDADVDYCDHEGSVVDDLTEFTVDDEEIDPSQCSSSFSQISATEFGMQFSCADPNALNTVFTGSITRISSTPGFDHGSLSIDGPGMTGDATVTSGVCGEIYSTDLTATTNDGVMSTTTVSRETNVVVIAPYFGEYLEIDITFDRATVTAGTYTVVGFMIDDNSESDTAVVDLYSVAAFGGTPDNPGSDQATGGTITITSIGDTSVQGSYSIMNILGDTYTGTFSLNY